MGQRKYYLLKIGKPGTTLCLRGKLNPLQPNNASPHDKIIRMNFMFGYQQIKNDMINI